MTSKCEPEERGMIRALIAIALAICALATPSLGQLRYKTAFNGTELTPTSLGGSPPSYEIDLGQVTSNTDLHIYDSSGVDDVVGLIRIRG
jgi:hypothetical protein